MRCNQIRSPALFFALTLTLGVFFGLSDAAIAGPLNLNIVSSGAWRSNDTLVPGWQGVAFNDSSWDLARAPYPNPTSPQTIFGGATAAQLMWHDPANTSNGQTGPIEAFFRFSFNLNLQPDSLPIIGQALIAVDDDYDFFVNGTLVKANHDGGFATLVDFVDFTPFLQNGANVFAIQARDGGFDNNRDRLFEFVLFDARIATPEPSALALFGVGLAGLVVVRRRKISR